MLTNNSGARFNFDVSKINVSCRGGAPEETRTDQQSLPIYFIFAVSRPCETPSFSRQNVSKIMLPIIKLHEYGRLALPDVS